MQVYIHLCTHTNISILYFPGWKHFFLSSQLASKEALMSEYWGLMPIMCEALYEAVESHMNFQGEKIITNLKFLKFIWKAVRQRKTEIHLFTLQMGTVIRAGPSGSQERATHSSSPVWVEGTQVTEPSPAVFQSTLEWEAELGLSSKALWYRKQVSQIVS